MDTFDCISARASIRAYQSKSIKKELLEKLVDAGRRAPTARAVEPWDFVVIQDKQTLNKLAGLASNGSFIQGAAAAIAVFCQDTKYYLEDGCAATENILLAAADLGIGACWVAGDKKPYASQVAELFNLPNGYKLVSLLSLGWPAELKPQLKQRSLENVLHWERF